MILSENSSNFIKAFIAVRSLIGGRVEKNTANNHLKSKYADLGSVFKAITPAMEANGIVPIQNATMTPEGRVEVTTILMHESGETATFTSQIPLAKADAHGYGSAFTYARRYSLMGIFGLVPADDDGNASRKTAKDVTKALDKAEDLPALDVVLNHAKQYFSGDSASLRVIQSHYDARKADMQIVNAEGFKPLKPKQKAPTEQQPSAPVGDDVKPEINF
jgi:hypothetical protein